MAHFFVWPRLKKMELQDALIPLLFVLSFRYLGLLFLMPEVMGNTLPPAFAIPTAYGDLATSVLAIIAVLTLRYRKTGGIPLAWLVSLVGTLDFMYGYSVGITLKAQVGGPAYFIPVLFNPAMFVSHFMIWKLLISGTHTSPSEK